MTTIKTFVACLLWTAFAVAIPLVVLSSWAVWAFKRIELWAVYDGDACEQAKDW